MAHRSARDALRERREEILGQLAALETVEDADQARTLLLRELDEVRSSLELINPPRPLRMRLRLVRGCDMRWENMVGDARVRHCGACDREVYDLTAMSADEVEAFVEARQHDLPCVRLHARPDGRYQDGPCAPAERRHLTRAALAAAGLGLSGLLSVLASESHAEVPSAHRRADDIATHPFVEPIPEPCPWPAPEPTLGSGGSMGGGIGFDPMSPELDELEAELWSTESVVRAARSAPVPSSITLWFEVDDEGRITAWTSEVTPGYESVAAEAVAVASRLRVRDVRSAPRRGMFFHDFRWE
jgi:hypothetical protein